MGKRTLTPAGQKRREINQLRWKISLFPNQILDEIVKIKKDSDNLVDKIASLNSSLEHYFKARKTLEDLTTKQRKPK